MYVVTIGKSYNEFKFVFETIQEASKFMEMALDSYDQEDDLNMKVEKEKKEAAE